MVSLRPTLAWLLLVGILATPVPTAAQPEPPSRPNIVVVMTDDQRWNLFGSMPTVRHELKARGLSLTRAVASSPLCCPSRASFLTGTYPHTNGVWSNGADGVPGGWGAFRPLEDDTLATWLDAAGYQTGLFGKYLNQYNDPTAIPPGWDRWVAFAGRNGAYFDYDLTVDGGVIRFADAPDDYSTDVLGGYVESFIRTSDPGEPLFVYFAPFAPHGPATPAPRHARADVNAAFPSHGGVNERDVSDKPKWIRDLPMLDAARMDRLHDRAEREARALMAVDEAIARILTAMRETDRTDTLYVLLADQGIAWGEHRWTYKGDPYEPSIREALVLRWDGHIAPGARSRALVQNVDVAPTLAQVAGVATAAVDGSSFASLFDGVGGFRRYTTTEYTGLSRERKPTPPTYCVIREPRFKYIRYGTGEEELYALDRDPHEVRNLLAGRLRGHEPRRAYTRLSDIADQECRWMRGGVSAPPRPTFARAADGRPGAGVA
ncbi:MAG TPA: sulfatase [Actinomycetota bacterium]|nr:sulfatase [Actinomycetota bacterium]